MPDDLKSHIFQRRSPANGPRTINEESRTATAIISTGAVVPRNDFFDGVYDEELVISPSSTDLEQFKDMPVFLDHRREDSEAIVGRVVSAEIVGNNLIGTIRFSGEDPGATAFRKVQEGTFKSISMAYRVIDRTVTNREGGVPLVKVTKWTPVEVSLVGVPADAGAQIRSAADTASGNQDLESRLDGDEPPISRPRRAVSERDRRLFIDNACRIANLPQESRNDLIARGATVEEVRAMTFANLAQQSRVGGEINNRVAPGSDDNEAHRRRAMAEAIAARMNPLISPGEDARPYMSQPLHEMARECLEARGERTRMLTKDQIFERAGANSTSDFPNILTAGGNRALLAAFEHAPNALKAVARPRPGNAPDFRALSSLRLGEHPQLLEVKSGGEVTYGSTGEAAESYSLKTYARIFALTRQALINDDLGAFGEFVRNFGVAAAETEAQQLTALLLANSGAGATMRDTHPLFHTAHGNIAGAAAAISVTSLGTARQAMRDQKGIDGVTPINAAPRFLQVGSAYETAAEQYVALLSATTAADVNPFSGKLQVLVEPRLEATAWRLFADPNIVPVLEYAYLESAQGPQLMLREGFNVMGMEFRVSLDFGCGVVDWRGAYLTPHS